MAYSELVKNFNRIREYMREFYVYGFKSREEYTRKSAVPMMMNVGDWKVGWEIICDSARTQRGRMFLFPLIVGLYSTILSTPHGKQKVSPMEILHCILY